MKNFLWGVAISAYQAEGGYNRPGEPETNWAEAERAGEVAPVGNAADFWTRFPEDFARCRELGLTAFRLSVEWSRVQPVGPNVFDRAALEHYARILKSCRAHSLEPVVTLHHFVHPAWLGPDPWLEESTPELFVSFARTTIMFLNAALAEPLRWLITINEPNMLVLNSYLARQFPAGPHRGARVMMQAYNQLLRAHVLAYNAVHDVYAENGWAPPQVTFNNYCSDVYWSDKVLLDLVCARERGIARDQIEDHVAARAREFDRLFREARLPLHRDIAFYFGTAAKRLGNWFGYKLFSAEIFSSFLDTLYASPRARLMDYIAIDYYDPFAAHAFRLPVWWDHEFKNKSFRSWMLATVTSKWWDWRVLPRGLDFFCRHYASDYQRPVLIAENGMALRRRADGRRPRRDKITRSEFLRLHVREVSKLVRDGVPVIGYLHWSLFDNYEWGTFTPRFGLYAIDFSRGTERALTDPDGDRPAETYAALIREVRD
ncbi:glycoside hydrolase family 1 protein [Oleiharenicola lentus]|uniref:glycoside hydrolase family 1 protein n=1 Tax=Oleiharenicola lentus TaxID=2508720 RepID=UPI003F6662CC